jgi:hypothetical protein
MSKQRQQRQDEQQNPQDPDARRSSGPGISRRSLLKAGGAATLAGTLLASQAAVGSNGDEGTDGSDFDSIRDMGAHREDYWDASGTFFTQKNVDTSQIDQNLIRARIDGQWHDFVIRELDDAFFNFNIGMRTRMLEVMTGTQEFTIYNDAHNAAVGTYGSNRGDSRFTVNVAFKGMGWVPRKDRIDERTDLYATHYTSDMMTKMQHLFAGYNDPDLWDRRLQGSLELYTSINNETHTFLNQMVNPVSTICFLGDESYEMRAITRLMHPDDPNLSEHEKKLVKWINFAHDFFHGGPDPSKLIIHNIGVAYWIVEEFDNSPFGATDTAGGQKRVPAL